MTVPSEVSKAGPYHGDNVATVFGFDFKIVDASHIQVIVRDAQGDEHILVLNADYTVSGVGNDEGSITKTTPLAVGDDLTILRNVPFTQETDLENQGAYYAETVEDALDLAAMRDQQLKEGLDRAVKVPENVDPGQQDNLVADIMRLADSADNIDTVANNIGDVNAVAGSIANVNTVANNIAAVNDVAAIKDAVVDVASIKGNVNTVAGDHDEIVALAAITGNINTVAGIAPKVTTVADNAADVSIVADNIADVTNFADVYIGPKASDPATRNDGSALHQGDLYFNTTTGELRIYDGANWQSITDQSLVMADQSYVGDGSQTVFTLPRAAVNASNVIVWVGGVRQVPDIDYTVTGSTLTLATAPGIGVAVDTLVVSTISESSGVPAGGAAGQVLTKIDGDDYNTEWKTPASAVPDGSVTDPKLPAYSDTNSPSASKMRFRASTSAAAMLGSIQRNVALKLSDFLSAEDFGVKADGATDDTAAMVAALREAEYYGRPLFLPAGVIMVNPDALFIGTGAEGVNSAYNNQTIIGVGSSPAFMSGTVIRSRSAGGILFDVRGLINGVTLSGVVFDCANVTQYGVRIRSMSESNWSQFSVRNFTGIGIDWNCRANPSGSPTWSSGNVMQQFYITSSVVADYGVGLLLDGQISTNKDPHRNTFNTGIIQINKGSVNPTFAMQLNMTDSNTFIEIDADTIGAGIGFGLRLSALTSNGFPFPQNNFFYGCSIKGYDVAEDAGTGKLIGQNMFINMTTMDGETLPTHPKLLGFTDTGTFFYSPVVSATLAGFEFRSRNGSARYRIFANVSDTVDGGFEIQKFVGGAWTSYLRIANNGALFTLIPGLGLKQIQAGDPDTGGSGFRRLVVAN